MQKRHFFLPGGLFLANLAPMKQLPSPLALIIALSAVGASASSAALISGVGTPAFPFSGLVTVVDFESAPITSFNTAVFGNLTISGSGGSGFGSIGNTYSSFIGTGNYLENGEFGAGFTEFHFSFANPIKGFAFNLVGNDALEGVGWALEAFKGATSVGTYTLPFNNPDNGVEFFGVTGSNISSVRLFSSGGQEWVVLDNLSFVESEASVIPEPSGVMALGLLLASGTFFRSRRKARN